MVGVQRAHDCSWPLLPRPAAADTSFSVTSPFPERGRLGPSPGNGRGSTIRTGCPSIVATARDPGPGSIAVDLRDGDHPLGLVDGEANGVQSVGPCRFSITMI